MTARLTAAVRWARANGDRIEHHLLAYAAAALILVDLRAAAVAVLHAWGWA